MSKPKTTKRGRGPDGRYISVPINQTSQIVAAPKRGRTGTRTKPAPKTATIKRQMTHVALIVDRSGSMSIIERQAIDAFNMMVDTIKDLSKQQNQDVTITIVFFNGSVERVSLAQSVDTLKPLTVAQYKPCGGTALFDGVGKTIEALKGLKDSDDPNTSFLALVITDGEENSSMQYRSNRFHEALKDLHSDDRWTITFQLPKGARDRFCREYQIPVSNTREWEQTTEGVQQTANATSVGLSSYFNARSKGQTKVENFFADLSKVTTTKVKAQLDDLKGQYKQYTVEKECEIKEFVEAKTGKPYVTGSTYYELTKPETVQPQKDVLIVERGKEKEAIYGGVGARDMLGLPQGVNAKLSPANLSKWRVLIKSTSVNRKLVRGTIVLIDKTKIVPDTPTWDHTKVK